MFNRRQVIRALGSTALVSAFPIQAARAAEPALKVDSRVIEVLGKPAKVFGVTGAGGANGLMASEGDRLSGALLNATTDPLVMHWHGQIHAPENQDRARPGGGELIAGGIDMHDFLLTPGTHWTHSHQLSEQQLLAAPMITREKSAGSTRDIVIMLHDFAFRSPAEILTELAGPKSDVRDSTHGHQPSGSGLSGSSHQQSSGMRNNGPGPMGNMQHGSMGSGMMGGAPHANDVRYDAYLANDRTLDDPEVVKVDAGEPLRLRIINGGTATAFFIDTGLLDATCIAVDGTPCNPLKGRRFPLAQGQRIDLQVIVPCEGGAYPILAQVEADRRRTGIVLTTAGARISKIENSAQEVAANATLGLDERLRAVTPLPARKPDQTFHLMLGEEAGYRWTINGRIHGEHSPLRAKRGERIAIMFMNPTSMMHPMHLHGHHFQVVGTRAGRFPGPMRDTVIVPPHTPVIVEFDADKTGSWYLHCHHLYHMATGMMTEIHVS